MTTKSIIDTALKCLKKYGSVYKFIKENGLVIKYVDLEVEIKGLTFDNIIFINSNIDDFEKEFVLAHEIGHYLLHDDTIRQFSKIEALKGSQEETQANIFATVFLQCRYNDCDSDDEIQSIINYICCNCLSGLV